MQANKTFSYTLIHWSLVPGRVSELLFGPHASSEMEVLHFAREQHTKIPHQRDKSSSEINKGCARGRVSSNSCCCTLCSPPSPRRILAEWNIPAPPWIQGPG